MPLFECNLPPKKATFPRRVFWRFFERTPHGMMETASGESPAPMATSYAKRDGTMKRLTSDSYRFRYSAPSKAQSADAAALLDTHRYRIDGVAINLPTHSLQTSPSR